MDRRVFLRYLGVGLGAVAVSGLAPTTIFGQASLDNGAATIPLWLLATGRANCLESDVYEYARSAILAEG